MDTSPSRSPPGAIGASWGEGYGAEPTSVDDRAPLSAADRTGSMPAKKQHTMLAQSQATTFSDSMRRALMGEDSGKGAPAAAATAAPGNSGEQGGVAPSGGGVAPQHRALAQAQSSSFSSSMRNMLAGESASSNAIGESKAERRHHRTPERQRGSRRGSGGELERIGEYGSPLTINTALGASATNASNRESRRMSRASRASKRSRRSRRGSNKSAAAAIWCTVCLEEEVTHFNIPCCHRSMCAACFANEQTNGTTYCPVCLEAVEQHLAEDDPQVAEYFKNHEEWTQLRMNATFQQVLDDEWEQHLDAESGEAFYYNTKTYVTQWEYPLEFEDATTGVGADRFAYEGLGVDYMETAWVPPTVEKAKNYKRSQLFGHGVASCCRTGTDDLAALGLGVSLYFRLVKYLTIVMLIMSIVALPMFWIYQQGSRMPERVPDTFGLSKYSLGNAGDPSAAEQWQQDNSSQSVFSTSNVTSVDLWGWQLTSVGGAYMLSFCDFLNTWVFLAFLVWMKGRISSVEEHSKKHTRAKDFSVFVRKGLPRDATEAQLRKHFSGLFSLVSSERDASRRDLRLGQVAPSDRYTASGQYSPTGTVPTPLAKAGRAQSVSAREFMGKNQFVGGSELMVYAQPSSPLRVGSPSAAASPWTPSSNRALLKPVEDYTHNGKQEYYGSWVADVHIVHPNGHNLRTYLAIEELMSELRTARARACMYAPNTPLSTGPSAEKCKAANEKVNALEYRMAEIKSKIEAREDRDEACIGAFVTFNHEESFLRCVKEYDHSRSWINRMLLQPKYLRFRRKHRLLVVPAPDPSDLVWENLETPWIEAFCRRQITAFITFLLLVVSFLVILSAQSAQQRFLAQVPDLGMCNGDLPQLFLANSSSFAAAQANLTSSSSGTFTLTRPPLLMRGIFDQQCPDGMHYLTYDDLPGLEYDIAGCEQGYSAAARASDIAAGGPEEVQVPPASCPDPRKRSQCPCALSGGSGQCPSLTCYGRGQSASGSAACHSFSEGTTVGCYCMAKLEAVIEELGTFAGGKRFLDTEDDVCGDWASTFFLSQLLTGLAAGAVAMVNVALKLVLERIVRFEHHRSVTKEQRAVAVKIFLAITINTSLVVLVVHGKLPNGIKFPVQGLGVLEGKYDDFAVEWYGSVGVMLLLTMCANLITPHAVHLLHFCCTKRFKQRKAKQEGYFLTQADMNEAFVGPPFDLAERYAEVLAIVFVTLMFSAGLPMLLPIAVCTLGMHFNVDKLLILRFHAKPPNYGAELNHLAASLLPYAALLHLAFAAWMFGNNDILDSLVINPAIIEGWTPNSGDEAQALYDAWFQKALDIDGIGLAARVVRVNVFPHALLFCLLLAFLVVWALLGPYIESLAHRCWRGHWKSNLRLDRKFVSPFTAEFAKLLVDAEQFDSDDEDSAEVAAMHMAAAAGAGAGEGGDDQGSGAHHEKLSRKMLSKLELNQGWRVRKRGGILVLQKQWIDSRTVHGIWHERGQLKRTWEVVADFGLPSYDIHANPKYNHALRAKKEQGFASDSEEEEDEEQSSSEEEEEDEDGNTVTPITTPALPSQLPPGPAQSQAMPTIVDVAPQQAP